MTRLAFHKTAGLFAPLLLTTLLAQVSAGPGRPKLAGDWRIKVDADGRQRESVLSISTSKEGRLSGEWIGFRGTSELRNVQYDGSQLSFERVRQSRNGERTTRFVGTVERGKLSGTLSSDRGEYKVDGRRIRPTPRAAGSWEAKIKVGEREFAATLIVKADKRGKLTGEWRSQWGEHEIRDVAFKNGELRFTRKSKAQDREWESTFEGKVKGHRVSGTLKSERGDIPLEGKRIGASLVGKWALKTTTDSGTRTQILKVNPDLTGMYGPVGIERIALQDNQVSFQRALKTGESEFEIRFAGKLEGKKLTGELTSPRGVRKVEGQKIARGRQPSQLEKDLRKPDVIFVPTPQEVVDKMLELATVTKDDLVYDLGCGDGRIVVTAAKRYGCRGVGYDIAWKRVKESRENVKKNDVGDLVRIEQKDIFTLDLSEASVITLYLLPKLNVRLIPQLKKLKPGSRIVSHDFAMKGVEPEAVVEITSDDHYEKHTIYLWTTPLKIKD